MFNLPSSIFNFQSMMNRQPQSKWSTTNPFRTVEVPGAYGDGLNSSASQLYSHMLRFKDNDYMKDRGFRPAHKMQSMDDFLTRRNPVPVQQPQPAVPPPQAPTSGGYQGVIPNFGGFNPANGIFNMQPMQQPVPQPDPTADAALLGTSYNPSQQWNRPMTMPSGGPAPRQAIPMPNMSAGIFNMPQLNRR